MSKVTQRPWSHTHIFAGEEVISGGVDCQTYVCTVQAEVNAAHVVKCVNMHDELVEMLKVLATFIDTGMYEGNEHNLALAGEVSALLAKAKGRNE